MVAATAPVVRKLLLSCGGDMIRGLFEPILVMGDSNTLVDVADFAAAIVVMSIGMMQ